MFTTADIRHLITLFPPAITHSTNDIRRLDADSRDLSSTGSSSLLPAFIPSADSTHLYPLPNLQRKLQTYIDAHGSVSAADLSSLLDVADSTQILQWADRQPSLSTPRHRKPDLSTSQQKTVAIWFFDRAARTPVRIEDAARFFGVDATTAAAIIRSYGTSFGGVREIGDWWLTNRLWERSTKLTKGLIDTAFDDAREAELSALRNWTDLPVRALLQDAIAEQSGPEHWDVRQEGGKWVFVPLSAMRAKLEGSLDDEVKMYRGALEQDGWCAIRGLGDQRDQVLKKLKSDSSLDGIFALHRSNIVDERDWPADETVLVSSGAYGEATHRLLEHIASTAKTIWQGDQDKDLVLSARVVELLSSAVDDSDDSEIRKAITKLVLRSSSSTETISQALSTQAANLAAKSSESFLTILRNDLQYPLHLYTAPSSLYQSDPTLAEHQTSFVYDFARSDILPSFLKSVSSVDLSPPKDFAKELSKFKTATNDARNVDTLLAAIKKFCRKVKLPDVHTPLSRAGGRSLSSRTTSQTTSRTASRSLSSAVATDSSTLTSASDLDPAPEVQEALSSPLLAARDAALTQHLLTLRKAKRPSDVLQQATWILLAAMAEEGMLFVSGGRDAGRMVKLLQRLAAGEKAGTGEDISEAAGFSWVRAGEELEVFRGKVKAGTQTEADVKAVKELAARAFEARKAQ